MSATALTSEQVNEALTKLGERVTNLENGQQAAFAPVNNFVIDPEGKTKLVSPEGAMFWAAHWNPVGEYEADDVVKYKSSLYIALESIEAPPEAPLILPPMGVLVPKWLATAPTTMQGVLTNKERYGSVMTIKDPKYPETNWNFDGTLPHGQIWQFLYKRVEGHEALLGFIKVFRYNGENALLGEESEGRDVTGVAEYAIVNDEGQVLGNNNTPNKADLSSKWGTEPVGEPNTKRFYIVVATGARSNGPTHFNTLPISYEVEIENDPEGVDTGEIVEEHYNEPPSEDYRWEKVA